MFSAELVYNVVWNIKSKFMRYFETPYLSLSSCARLRSI